MTMMEVKNRDELSRLIEVLNDFSEVKWVYVKGHSGILENQRADQLAKEGAENSVDILSLVDLNPDLEVVYLSNFELGVSLGGH